MTTRRARTQYQISLSLESNIDEQVRRLPDALQQFHLRELHESGAEFTRRTNWATWGERIELTWTRRADRLEVVIRIIPRLRTTMYDWGQGQRDAEAIERYLVRGATPVDDSDRERVGEGRRGLAGKGSDGTPRQ